MNKPSIAELLNASGHFAYSPELVTRAMYTLYGNLGANLDERNWSSILQSSNPMETAEAGLLAMYQDSGYLLRNTKHLEQSGFVAAQAEITYRQLADRLGYTHDTAWSTGTAYDGLSQKSTPQLVAEIPPPPPKTFTVTNNAGTLAFGGTATGDITFAVAADGTATFVRGGLTAATTLDVSTITNAGGTIKLAANATSLSVAKAAAMIAITGFDANGFTYSISDTAAALAANVGAPITGAINVTVTDAATIAQLTTIDGLTTGTITATAITGLAADLVTNAGGYVAGAVNVTVTDAATIAQLTTIDGLTTGTLTYTAVRGLAADLAVNAGGYIKDAINVTVTDAVATAAHLNTIDAATTAVVDATAVTTITGSGADFAALGAAKTAGTITLAANFAATVTDPVNVADANLFDAATTGVVTATISETAAATLAALTGTGNAYTITVTGAASAAHLNTINAATTVSVTATGVTSISGLAADFGTLLVAKAANEITLAANFAATVTDSDADETALNPILDATTGVVTASLTGAAVALNNVLTNATATDALTITLTGPAAALDLIGLDGKTSVNVGAGAITSINGAAAEVKAVVDAATITKSANYAATISDGDANEVTLNAILGATTGVVTANLAGVAATLNSVLTNGDANDALTITLDAGTADASVLTALDGRTSVAANATNITAITGSAADFAALLAAKTAGTIILADNFAATVTDAVNVADINLLDAITTGVVTASISDNGAGTLAGLTGTNNAYAITVTGAATAAHLNTINAATTVAVNATGVTDITGSNNDFGILRGAKGASEITLAMDFAATVTDVAADPNMLNILLGETTGIVTASLSGTAVALNGSLDQAAADDLLTITLTGGSADISYIVGLNGKTAVEVNATAVTTITSFGMTMIDLTAPGVTWASGINVTGSGMDDTIIGTGGNDTITGGAGNDTLAGGAGHDTFTFVAGVSGSAADVLAANGTDILNDFSTDDVLGVVGLLGGASEVFVGGDGASVNQSGTANVIVITDNFAPGSTMINQDVDTIFSEVGSHNGSGVMVFNNNGVVQVWYDSNVGSDQNGDGVTLLGTITTGSAAADLASLTAAHFA